MDAHDASCHRSEWHHTYPREEAAFPCEAARVAKFWPSVGRINNVSGDRSLICSCPPVEDYQQSAVTA